MGVAVGDYDGDGFPDIYVTQYPKSILYHNNGDGTFADVTAKAGVAAPGWATSAVWFDYDNDGRLDLFVCRFVDYSKDKLKFCGDRLTGERLLSSKYSETANWAKSVSATGQPIRDPEKDFHIGGSLVSPNNTGVTNWPPPRGTNSRERMG